MAHNERHTFSELVENLSKNDIENNFVYQHPLLAMSAAQKMLSMVNIVPPRKGYEPNYTSHAPIRIYPVFSDGIREADGLRIIGQYEAIEALVSHLRSAASGRGDQSKMLLFLGPSGTGKTEFLKILQAVGTNLTLKEPAYFNYKYTWKNLEQIPTLAASLRLVGAHTDHDGLTFSCQLNDSPFALLPESFQKSIIKLIAPKARKMMGETPLPPQALCPHCEAINDEIIAHHMKKMGEDNFTDEALVAALNNHLIVERWLWNKESKIDAEAKEADLEALFCGPNLKGMDKAPCDPFHWHLTGKFLSGSGRAVYLDEFFRTLKSVRDMVLGAMEDHRFRQNGGPTINTDMLIFGASNTESVVAASQNGTESAHIDRMKIVQMGRVINPFLAAKLLLMMQAGFPPQRNLKVEKLGEDRLREIKTDKNLLDELFVEPLDRSPLLGPDHRFKISFKTGASFVHLSPHTLMYMAMTSVATRLETNVTEALRHGPRQVIIDAVFQDVYARMRAMMRLDDVTEAQRIELNELSAVLNEGHFGMSDRDAANIWLSGVLARAEQKDVCMTPELARDVLHELLDKKSIKSPDLATAARWKEISQKILRQHTIPSLSNDVMLALGTESGNVDAIYSEVISEMIALASNKSATTYERNGQSKKINRKRLQAVEKEFSKNNTNRMIDYHNISVFAATARGDVNKKHRGLYDAVTAYLSKQIMENLSYDTVIRYFDDESIDVASEKKLNPVRHSLGTNFGYCSKCMKAAVELAQNFEDQSENAPIEAQQSN